MIFSTSRGPSTLATFVAVYALFGPTYPGIFDKDRGIYTLFYPVHSLDIKCLSTIALVFYDSVLIILFALYFWIAL